MRASLLLLALATVACDRSNRPASSTQSGDPALYAGPPALVLRLPRAGGPPRVFGYPRVDSLVWESSDPTPAPAEVLAFDDENGSVAYTDTRGRGVLLELQRGTITDASTTSLKELASADGMAIFGIARNGDVVRMTPAGDWTLKPPAPANQVYPERNGSLLVSVGRDDSVRMLKYTPPGRRVVAEIDLPSAARTMRTQLGDRLFLVVDSGLIMLRTRTMDWGPSIRLAEPIEAMVSTPSGDRVFILTDSGRQISVVDRFREMVTARFQLPGRASDLRIDQFGRYLLARSVVADSIWIAAIGTERVTGGVRGTWRNDLPFVGYDGSVAVAVGTDVVLYDGETLKEQRRVRGGASDYWYPIMWDGFRPRAASLDEPVRFDSALYGLPATDTLLVDSAAADTSGQPAAPVDPLAARGFVVSFAAFLVQERARELASRIQVDGAQARVVSTPREGATIYRVILGPYFTREEAERAGRESQQAFWVYEGAP
ncbi:MAG: SPOR domain-containing protein [Gemmatimonadaceae bacterium]